MNNTSPIKTISKKRVYSNPWLTLEEHNVINADGSKGMYGILDYGDGVSILAVNDKNQLLLIKEYKYAIQSYTYQLPSGSVEKNEMPLLAAQRELKEESGIECQEWHDLGCTHPFPTNITTKVYLYFAKGLKVVGQPENGIDLLWVDQKKVFKMIEDGNITHSGSLVCLLKYFLKMTVEQHP